MSTNAMRRAPIRQLFFKIVIFASFCWGAALLLGAIFNQTIVRFLGESGVSAYIIKNAAYHQGLVRSILNGQGDSFFVGAVIFLCGVFAALLFKNRCAIERIANIECPIYLLCIFILFIAQRGLAFYVAPLFWIFFLFSLVLCSMPSESAIYTALERTIRKIITNKVLVFGFSLGLLLFWFLVSFPLKDWGLQIAVADYPKLFFHLMQGADTIKQGGFFGWSSSFLGGQFTAAYDATIFLSLILMLFSLVMKPEVAYHLMWLLFFLSFPILCYLYVKRCFNVKGRVALLVLPIACYFELSYFANLFEWGMLGAFAGLNLVIISLIMFHLVKEGRRFSFFYLILTLSFLFYTHLGMFFYGVLLIMVDCMLAPNRKAIKAVFSTAGLLLAIALPYLFYKVRYPSYLIVDNVHYFPMRFSFGAQYWSNVSIWLFAIFYKFPVLNIFRYPLLFLPVTIYMLRNSKWRNIAIYSLLCTVSVILFRNYIGFAFSRIIYLGPFLIALLLSGFLIINFEKKVFVKLLLLVVLSLLLLNPAQIKKPVPFEHFNPSLYNKDLVGKIESLSGRYIAVENNTHFVKVEGKSLPQFVWLPTLQAETGKLIFGNPGPWYVHSPYRKNSFDSGEFRGVPVGEWEVENINEELAKWGVSYLVMWNKDTVRYFNSFPEYYENIWTNDNWTIFRNMNADMQSAVTSGRGKVHVEDNDYFEKRISLSGIKKGEKVEIISNYFPAWKAYYGQKEMTVHNYSGLIGFVAPATGDYEVTMKYPRYGVISAIVFFALAVSWMLSYRKVLP